MIDSRSLGRFIRNLRTEHEWSLEEMAERAEISPSYVSRLERGHVDSPTLEVARRIAAVFGLTVQELTEGAAVGELNPEQKVFARVRRILETIPPEQWLDHTEVWEQVSQIARGSLAAAGQSPFLSQDSSPVSSDGERTNETTEGPDAPLAECKILVPVRRRARDLQPV